MVGALVRSKYRHDVSRCVEFPIDRADVFLGLPADLALSSALILFRFD